VHEQIARVEIAMHEAESVHARDFAGEARERGTVVGACFQELAQGASLGQEFRS